MSTMSTYCIRAQGVPYFSDVLQRIITTRTVDPQGPELHRQPSMQSLGSDSTQSMTEAQHEATHRWMFLL